MSVSHSNQHLSLLIDLGTELAKDLRVQQSVADRLKFHAQPQDPDRAALQYSSDLAPAQVLAQAQAQATPLSSTATTAGAGRPATPQADLSGTWSDASWCDADLPGCPRQQEAADATAPISSQLRGLSLEQQTAALIEHVSKLERQIKTLQEDLSFQQDMNEHLVYQNCQLQDALEKKELDSVSQAQQPLERPDHAANAEAPQQGPTAQADMDYADMQDLFAEEFGVHVARDQAARCQDSDAQGPSASQGPPPERPRAGSQDALIQGALGIAASIIILAWLRQRGSPQVEKMASVVMTAAASAAHVLGLWQQRNFNAQSL